MSNLASKLTQEKSPEKNMWEIQAGKFTTSQKVNVDFCLPEFSATKIVSWKYHINKKIIAGII